jgi:hypothetical protein
MLLWVETTMEIMRYAFFIVNMIVYWYSVRIIGWAILGMVV